jgi:serine/threonine-protein kinase
LNGKKLKAAKKKIKAADCRVGLVSKKNGVKVATGKVVKQSPKPGKVLPAKTGVSVRLG